MMATSPVITVDGPSGAGKGALCKALSRFLGWHLLDSGAIYRVLALAALRYNLDITSKQAMTSLAAHLDVCFMIKNGKFIVILEGTDVSDAIRSETIGNTASKAAALPYVREALLLRQRAFRDNPGLIADGRDMGTVVFPDAEVKIFLYASPESRAHRRMVQLQERGFNVNFTRLLIEIKKRDSRDSKRIISPMAPASDAFMLDSSNLPLRDVIQQVLGYIRKVLTLPLQNI